MTELAYTRVQSHLERLKLPQMATCLDGIAQQAVKDSCTYVDFLDRLLEAEVSARYERDVAMKVKLAHFPFLKTLDAFNFAFQPSINERQIQELATFAFCRPWRERAATGPAWCGQDPPGYRPGHGRHCPSHQRLLCQHRGSHRDDPQGCQGGP
jgi:DNA replication protein DnaC